MTNQNGPTVPPRVPEPKVHRGGLGEAPKGKLPPPPKPKPEPTKK